MELTRTYIVILYITYVSPTNHLRILRLLRCAALVESSYYNYQVTLPSD